MNCIIPGQNLKVLSKALSALAKTGDEIFIEAKENVLSFITLNLSKTVCAKFIMNDSFFSNYDVNKHDLSKSQTKTLCCKMLMRFILPLFKGSPDKLLDFLKITYENDSDYIYFIMKYKVDGIFMTHKLHLLETDISVTIGVDIDDGSNNICATSSFYNQLLTLFNISDDEITLDVTKKNIISKNYYAGMPQNSKQMKVTVTLNPGEFSVYHIETETTVNFALKPIRTAISFAEHFNLSIGLNFDIGGRPLNLILKSPTFAMNLIVATLNPNDEMASTLATTTIPVKAATQKDILSKYNVTIDDLNAIENENWDQEMLEVDLNTNVNTNTNNEFNKIISNIGHTKNVTKSLDVRKIRTESSIFEKVPTFSSRNSNFNNNSPVFERSESPTAKIRRIVFGRCLEDTFVENRNFGEVLCPASDDEEP